MVFQLRPAGLDHAALPASKLSKHVAMLQNTLTKAQWLCINAWPNLIKNT